MLFSKSVTKSVDSILSTFSDMVKQLEQVKDDHKVNIEANDNQIRVIQADTTNRLFEVAKATAAITKLKSIIGE